jgi:hypothetical protein
MIRSSRLAISLLGAAMLAACSGGGGSGVPVVTKPSGGGALTGTTAAIVRIQIPLHVTAGSAHTRAPQFVSPNTSFFLVDLQGATNALFDNTFTVDSTHCTPGTNGGNPNLPTLDCTFSAQVPSGDPTAQNWSIAAGAGNTDGTSGTPLSVIHNAHGQVVGGQTEILAFLDTVVASVSLITLQLGNFQGPSPAVEVPYFGIVAMDAFGNAVAGDVSGNIGIEQFANPIALTEDDGSGQLGMGVINHAGGPSPFQPSNPSPVTTVTFDRLNQLAAIEIVDNATISRTMNVSYSLPEMDLQPSEFPQLARTWRSPAITAKLATFSCVPTASVPAGSDPCTQSYP